MEIRKYSVYAKNDLVANGGNYTNIVDKLIRLTSKFTEHYASDIIYDINLYQDHIKQKEKYDFILCFREMGVNSYFTKSVINPDFNPCSVSEFIQTWRLTYDPENNECNLFRVELVKGR